MLGRLTCKCYTRLKMIKRSSLLWRRASDKKVLWNRFFSLRLTIFDRNEARADHWTDDRGPQRRNEKRNGREQVRFLTTSGVLPTLPVLTFWFTPSWSGLPVPAFRFQPSGPTLLVPTFPTQPSCSYILVGTFLLWPSCSNLPLPTL